MVKIVIDGKVCEAEEGESVLAVARREGIDIPALCYDDILEPYGACRMCLVEVVKGAKKGITTSCTLRASEGLEVLTDTLRVVQHRKIILELYLAQAPMAAPIKELAKRYGVKKTRFPMKVNPLDPLRNRCILCGLCIRVCGEVMGASAINYIGRGQYTEINTPFLEKSDVCMGCGACAEVCPTDAIEIKDSDGVRLMSSWSNTEVELKRCSVCGRYFAPQPVVRYVADGVDVEMDEKLMDMCPDCRRKYVSKRAILMVKGEVER